MQRTVSLITASLLALFLATTNAFTDGNILSFHCHCNAVRASWPSTTYRQRQSQHIHAFLFEEDIEDAGDNTNENEKENENKKENDSSSFEFSMASLNSRFKQVAERESRLPLVVLDSMLPRQVLEIRVNNALLVELIKDCMARESPYVGMLGIARLASGERVHLSRGVEVEIVKEKLSFPDDNQGVVEMALRATGRRFQIEEGSIRTVGGENGYTEAKVQFLDSAEELEQEVKARDDITDDYDRMSPARAIMKAKEFTDPNKDMPNSMSLVDRWIELARMNERSPGQIDAILKDLGEIPPADQPSERAFWVGALINPLPGMGVALEIRPALLTARKAEQRVEVALHGMLKSIKYMDGSARLV